MQRVPKGIEIRRFSIETENKTYKPIDVRKTIDEAWIGAKICILFLDYLCTSLPRISSFLTILIWCRGNTIHYLLHGCHHKHPMDGLRLVFPPAGAAIIAGPSMFSFFSLSHYIAKLWKVEVFLHFFSRMEEMEETIITVLDFIIRPIIIGRNGDLHSHDQLM